MCQGNDLGVAGWDVTSLLSHSNSLFFSSSRDQKGNQENREERACLDRR